MIRSTVDRPLRVVAYTDAAGVGGAEISLGHLVSAVSPTIDVTVVGVSESVVTTIAARRPSARSIVLPAGGVAAVAAHLATFHRLQPDIVHCNLCTPWACAIGLAAALTLPNARVVRVDQLPLRTTALTTLLRTRLLSLRVDAHVAVGEASARRMEDFYALGRYSVMSVPNCVPDLGEPKPPASSSDQSLTVGSVGRLDRMKGHDVLLHAIAQVDRVNLVILGEGAERQALVDLATELGVRDRVSLPGWVEQPRERLAEFDVVAMPSRSEGFPLAIVEAMLAARPVVATRVGSVAELVVDGETGMLIEKDDVTALAGALRQLRDAPELRWQMGQRGRDVAVRHFTVEQMAAKYEHLWEKLVSQPQAARVWVPRPRD